MLPPQMTPVGGRLSIFVEGWKRITNDPYVLSIVAKGYRLRFTSPPLLCQIPWEIRSPQGPEEILGMREQITLILQKNAITEVPPNSPGFYSNVFLVRKASGVWRPVIDLKNLNAHIHAPHFRMFTTNSVLSSVRKGDYAFKIDLQDAYFHLPIHPSSRKYLRFAFENKVYQFRVLPFGLNTAPQVFPPSLVHVSNSGATSPSGGCSVSGLAGEVNVHVSSIPSAHQTCQSHSKGPIHPGGRCNSHSPWWPNQSWFPHLLRLCVEHPWPFTTVKILCPSRIRSMSRTESRSMCTHGGSHATQ